MVDLAATLEAAESELASKRVVALPDFFIDRFVPVEGLDPFMERVRAIHGRGGGNLPVLDQRVRVGGDAANTAYALGRLGVAVRLVSNADAFGHGLLEAVLGPLGVDLGGVKPSGRSAGTVALEFADGANVMLSDAGPLASFGPKDLTDEDWTWVDESDAVLIGNWSQTFAHGTELIEAVLARASDGGAFTMLDTSDPTHRAEKDARRLVEDPSPLGGLSCWALNEVEAAHFARLATGKQASDLVEAGRAVADAFGGRVDVHSGRHAVTIDQGRVTRVDVDPIQPKRRTGAGDAWNAGSLLGTLLGLGHADRLRVANAVAGCLLTSHDHVPPDLGTLSAWLGRQSPAKATAMDK